MRRFWFGVICLLVLLALGIGSTALLQKQIAPVRRELEQTFSAAAEENWPLVREGLDRAKDAWQSSWHFLGSILPHGALEEADALLAELETYLQSREAVSFRSALARLLSLLEALGEGQRPLFWNLL